MNYILYVAYVIFFGCMFLTNEIFLAYHFFIYLVAPIALAPIWVQDSVSFKNLNISNFELSVINPLKTLQNSYSLIFCAIFLFCLGMVISSSITPSFSFSWLQIFVIYSIAICLFVLITARLCFCFDDFSGAFFTCFSSIVALNAAVNIYIYFKGLNNISDFASIRMTPVFGRAPDHYFTTGALSYAVAFAGSTGLFISETNWVRRVFGLITGSILFVAICLTQSRGPLFSAFAGILISGSIGGNNKKNWLYVVVPLIGTSMYLIVPEFSASLIARADNHRFEIWRKFLNLSLERPIFGVGERLLIYLEISDGEQLGHGHNIFLNAFMRGGMLSVISIIVVYSASLINVTLYKLREMQPIPFLLIATIILAGLIDFDQIVFLSDWQWTCFWLPLGVAVGCENILRYKKATLCEQISYYKFIV